MVAGAIQGPIANESRLHAQPAPNWLLRRTFHPLSAGHIAPSRGDALSTVSIAPDRRSPPPVPPPRRKRTGHVEGNENHQRGSWRTLGVDGDGDKGRDGEQAEGRNRGGKSERD